MKLNALVVDASRIMRKMVMEALDAAELVEFEFTEAEDGRDALEKFDPKTTHIVFAGWNMPRMSGIEFLRKARATGTADHIPIIMVTNEKTVGKMEVALDKAGANAYICKPFTVGDLRRKLVGLIDEIAKSSAARPKASKLGGFFSSLISE